MNVYYSVPLNVLCDSNGNPLQAVPQLAYGDVPAVVFAALDADNEPVDLSSATTWELTVDVDRAVETPHLCEVLPEGFTYNATNKTLSYRLNSRTLEFFSAVNGKSQLALIAELCGYDSSDTRLFRFPWSMIGVMPVGGGPLFTDELQFAVTQTGGDESTKTVSIRTVAVASDGSSVYRGASQTVLYDFNIPTEEA